MCMTFGVGVVECGLYGKIAKRRWKTVPVNSTFTNCIKYNELSFGRTDNQSVRMTEFFGGIEAAWW